MRAILRGEDLLAPEVCERIRELVRIKGALTPEEEEKLAGFVWRKREDSEKLYEGLGHKIRLALEVECKFVRPLDHLGLRRALNRLVGQPVTEIRRALAQVFEFGEQVERAAKYREDCSRGEWQLTIWAAWSIIKEGEDVFGSEDHTKQQRFYDRQTPPRDPVARERWQRARDFFDEFDSPGLVVVTCECGPHGLLRIELSEGYSLAVLPSTSSDDFEYWSLWNTRHDVHYNVYTDRLEVTVTRMRDPEQAT